MGEKENGIEGMLITSLTDEDLFAAGRRPSALDSKQSRTTDSEISGEVIHQLRSAEHAAKLARLETDEWRFHAQSLQASLERQRQLATIPSSDSEGGSYLGLSRQASRTSDAWEDLTACKKQIAEQQDCIARREAAIGRIIQKYNRAKKKVESMLTAEKDLQQSLESSLAEANGLRSLVEHHTARTEEYEELLAVKDAEIEQLQNELDHRSHPEQESRRSDEGLEPPIQRRSQNGSATQREQIEDQLRRKLMMERATSRELQKQLAATNDEIVGLKSSFKATLEDHRRRQISIGNVLNKLQSVTT